jgi:BarA-like signal transduction histidine kinase
MAARPCFFPALNTLFDLTFRVSLPSLPERFVDWFTVVLLGAGGFFPLRRLLIPRVRALTTARDWLVLALVMAPFVIAAIPFTAIGHMPFILFARLFASGE